MDVHEYLGVLRRGVVFIVLGVVLGLVAGLLLQPAGGPTYAATSRDLVTNKTSGDLTEWLQAGTLTEARIASYVLVASSGLVLQPVIDDLELADTVDELAQKITVTSPPDTFVIEITATASTPELARDIANAISAEFRTVVSTELEATDGTPDDSIAPVRVVNIEKASLPTAPLPSNGGLMLALGLVVGLVVGIAAASLRAALQTRVRAPKEIAAITPITVVGDIPGDRAVWTNPLAASGDAGSPIADAFRDLRAHIDRIRLGDENASFIITGAAPHQGTTTVTANLGVALAGTGASVVVVDADLRNPALSRLFGIHAAPGLSEVLVGRTTLDAALHSSDGGRLTVLPAGGRPSNPGELLATPAMRNLLAELRRRFEVVLVDAPAISAVSDAAVLASFDSSTLLVLARGATRHRVEEALALLAAGGSIPVGIVVSAIPRGRLFGRGLALRQEAAEPVAIATPAEPLAIAPTPIAVAAAAAKPSLKAAKPAVAAKPSSEVKHETISTVLAKAGLVERPIVIRPDPPKPSSRFAPDPAKFTPAVTPAYASAPAPTAGSEGQVPEPAVTGTVVDTVSTRIKRETRETPPASPPIRRILPNPGPVPIAPTSVELDAERTREPERPAKREPEVEPEPVVAGSLLGEIGGLPRVEVRAARPSADATPDPERQARESYEQRARELERVAHDRLMREQKRLAVNIREQLAHDKRELETVLDNRLEDTVLRPIPLPQRRSTDARFAGPDDDA